MLKLSAASAAASWTGSSEHLPLRLVAGVVVLALHAAAGLVLSWPHATGERVATSYLVTVQVVEIGPEWQAAAASPQETRPEPEAIVQPEPASVSEPEPEPEPELEPDTEPIPVPEPPKPKPPKPPKPKPEPRPEPKLEPKLEPKPESKPEAKPEPKPDSPQVTALSAPQPAPAHSPSGSPSATAAKPQAPPASAPPSNQPQLIGRVDYVRKVVPEYPRAAQQRRETGRVVVLVQIDTGGRVSAASIAQSSGHERLDRAALAAARKTLLKPYTVNGVAQPAQARIPYDFSPRK